MLESINLASAEGLVLLETLGTVSEPPSNLRRQTPSILHN